MLAALRNARCLVTDPHAKLLLGWHRHASRRASSTTKRGDTPAKNRTWAHGLGRQLCTLKTARFAGLCRSDNGARQSVRRPQHDLGAALGAR